MDLASCCLLTLTAAVLTSGYPTVVLTPPPTSYNDTIATVVNISHYYNDTIVTYTEPVASPANSSDHTYSDIIIEETVHPVDNNHLPSNSDTINSETDRPPANHGPVFNYSYSIVIKTGQQIVNSQVSSYSVTVQPIVEYTVVGESFTPAESDQQVTKNRVPYYPDVTLLATTQRSGSTSIPAESDQPVTKNTVPYYPDVTLLATPQRSGSTSTPAESDQPVFENTRPSYSDDADLVGGQQVFKNTIDYPDVTLLATTQPVIENTVRCDSPATPTGSDGDGSDVTDDEVDDEYDEIPEEYRIQGHGLSFAERNGDVMRAAIVAPRRRGANRSRVVNGVLRTPV